MTSRAASEQARELADVEPTTATHWCPGPSPACSSAGVLLKGQANHRTFVACIECNRLVRVARWVVDAGPRDIDGHRTGGHLCPACDPFISWKARR